MLGLQGKKWSWNYFETIFETLYGKYDYKEKNVEKYAYDIEKLNYKFSFPLLWTLPAIIK